MKKALSLVLALCMAASLLSGCGKKGQPNPPSSDGTTSQTEQVTGPTVEKPMLLKFGNSSAPDKLASVLMEKFCANVTERTGGAVVCEWYPAWRRSPGHNPGPGRSQAAPSPGREPARRGRRPWSPRSGRP